MIKRSRRVFLPQFTLLVGPEHLRIVLRRMLQPVDVFYLHVRVVIVPTDLQPDSMAVRNAIIRRKTVVVIDGIVDRFDVVADNPGNGVRV